MGFPKQVKKQIQLVPPKTLSARREQLLEYINKDGTYLPNSVLHADLDKGMLEFVKDELRTVVTGKVVPTVDILITTQNWSQFTETWNFVDLDKNVSPPFITTVRSPEVKYGSNPALLYTIPNRKQYYYATVPTWDGQRKGMDIYTIPQPVPVDITYSVKFICNRMRELNELNKNGQYVPIILQNISDESVVDLDKRKYYIQSYDFLMMGYLIDEEEFEVKPAISRTVQLLEAATQSRGKKKSYPKNPSLFPLTFNFSAGTTAYTENYKYTADLSFENVKNINSWDVYINGDYYGSDLDKIQLTSGNNLTLNITPTNPSLDSQVVYIARLI